MDKEDIINYVMETPGNSNPAVLGSMLDSYGGSSGGGGVFVVNVSYGESGEILADKTFSAINAAHKNGQEVRVMFEGGVFYPIQFGEALIEFATIANFTSSSATLYGYSVNRDNIWVETENQI